MCTWCAILPLQRHGCVMVTVLHNAGEIRGQVVFANNWNFQTPLTSLLSGGNAVPTTLSSASGSGQVVLSTDGTMGMAFLGLSGAWVMLKGQFWVPLGDHLVVCPVCRAWA